MERKEILDGIKKYFDISELVCPHVVSRFGEGAWRFLDTDYLHALLVIRRDILKRPMWCNKKSQTQRGFRCNMCELVKTAKKVYVTAHSLGKAGDFDVEGMKAPEARRLIVENADLLPCKVRLEKYDSAGREISWVHIDTIDEEKNPKVYEFRA